MTTTSAPSIAIIGAGPGGLVLARLLHLQNIAFTIFEYRPSLTATAPSTGPSSAPVRSLYSTSGSLDLHSSSGQLTLKECGLYTQFQSYIRAGCEDQIVVDSSGAVLHTDRGVGNRPEIERGDLIDLLLASIPAESIRYNHKLLKIEENTTKNQDEGKWTCQFGNGLTQNFDVVIGADGAWSRVRAACTDIKPFYAGINSLSMHIQDISTRYPDIAAFVGKGSLWAAGDARVIITHTAPSDSLHAYLAVRSDSETYFQDSTTGINLSNPAEAKRTLVTEKRFFGGWGQQLRDLISAGDEDDALTGRPLYMLPIGARWECKSGLAVLGDAAHVMTPYAGEGVNLAMLDALELSKALVLAINGDPAGWFFAGGGQKQDGQWADNLDAKLNGYHDKMFRRANSAAIETDGNKEIFFSDGAAQKLANMFKWFGLGYLVQRARHVMRFW